MEGEPRSFRGRSLEGGVSVCHGGNFSTVGSHDRIQMNGMALIWTWTFSRVALVSKVCSGGAGVLHTLASKGEHGQRPLLVGPPAGHPEGTSIHALRSNAGVS